MSRIPVNSGSSQLRGIERALKGLSRSVGESTQNTSGSDISQFNIDYDIQDRGIGADPIIGDTVYYDSVTDTISTERYAKGSIGLSTSSNLEDGNSSYRYVIGKADIIKTSDGKKWYVALLANSALSGVGSPNYMVKVWEIVDEGTGLLSFDYNANLLVTLSTISIQDISMSNVVEGSTDVFGVVVGDVDTTANTITFVRMTYDSGTGNFTMAGGGGLNDSSMGISHTNFDVRNGDLVFDSTQGDYLFFAVDSTSVKVERWQESNAQPQGVLTLASKAYTTDIPDKVNGFNIATILSDGTYLIVDGTSSGSWLYTYNGSALTPTGTNSTTIGFGSGFNGVKIGQDAFVANILFSRESEEVSFTLLEYDSGSSTFSQSTKSSAQHQLNSGLGRDFDTNKQCFCIENINTFFDINGNSIKLDSDKDIVDTYFSNGAGTFANMSVKEIDGALYYYSDFALPSSSGVNEYSEYRFTVTKTLVGNLQQSRLPIELGEVTGINSGTATVQCLLENVQGSNFVQGEYYGDFVAVSSSRAIRIREGRSLPTRFPVLRAITTASDQTLLKNGYQQTQTIHDNTFLLERLTGKRRYTLEVDKDTNVDNINFNIIVNGVPHYSDREITVAQSWYYIDVITEGTIFAHISVGLVCRAYLYDL